jgi:hypothetical protein
VETPGPPTGSRPGTTDWALGRGVEDSLGKLALGDGAGLQPASRMDRSTIPKDLIGNKTLRHPVRLRKASG